MSGEHAAQSTGISRRQALLGAAAVAGALSMAASGRLPGARADYMMAPEGSVGPAGGTDLPQMDAVKRVGKVTDCPWMLFAILSRV